MTIRNTYAAESWDKVYNAFSQINFTSYDYDTVKESLLQYLKIYHPENFNDFIESSELIALLELFSYVAELLAYRIDIASHENFITTAQRKQSVLKLARLISYRASRNIPARGLVKINTVRTTEDTYDSLGNNLANTTITWNDPNNTNWKEQFLLVMNKSMTSKFGQPSKQFQIGDVSMQLYTFNNGLTSFRNGVYPFSASGTSEQVQMEFVPADIDENGPFERAPDLNSQMNIIYASDGKGDGSNFTGFLGFLKQGSLIRTDYVITEPTANRRVELSAINVNDTDVWVYRVDDANTIIENWARVETLNEQNIYFNNNMSSRKKYEIETLENDKIAFVFGDGNFSDTAVGTFQFWTRVSVNQDLTIPANRISGQQMGFSYVNKNNVGQEFSMTFSLTAAIQNNAGSETIEHVRQSAPSTYYAQNRMVNGQDYNTYMLKDPTILRLKTVNRTFAGQPKYVEWNDSSRKYENVKLFGDDLTLLYDITADVVQTKTNAKTIIDTFIEPLLQTNGLLNSLTYVLSASTNSEGIISYPRRKFIEDNRQIYKDVDGANVKPYGSTSSGETGSLNEKSAIQSALDQHWYGEPTGYATINGVRHVIILDPTTNPKDDGKIYTPDIPRTVDGINTYPPGDTGSGLQLIGSQPTFGLRFNRFLSAFGTGTITLYDPTNTASIAYDGDVHAAPAVGIDYYKGKPETLTLEMTSDQTTFTVISNIRGKLPNYSLDLAPRWSVQTSINLPIDFIITAASTVFEAGDAFIIDISFGTTWTAKIRKFGTGNNRKVNLSGWWQLVSSSELGITSIPNPIQSTNFDPTSTADSWVFLISRTTSTTTGEVDNTYIYSRDIKIVAESLSTKFWYNQNTQIIDSSTKKPVYDKVRILRSNLDEYGVPLQKADIYDVVDFVYDSDGVVNFNRVELLPTDTINFTQAGDSTPDNVLQFISFSENRYEYFLVLVSNSSIASVPTLTAVLDPTNSNIVTIGLYGTFTFANSVTNLSGEVSGYKLLRRRTVVDLDFMWQHFSPVTHLIDPSVTNIHDAFLMTRGYYTNVINFVKGYSSVEPTPPTPLELRTSYGYLLTNKMISDTVVLHSGKIKLLFGSKADQKLRATFKVVKATGATFSDERIKSEIVSVIDTFFDIQNWEFGDRFYATELISLIHQKLPTQIASVVLVPLYSVNSFGSLFTIDSGFDEILQSAATVNDIEMVDALTPTILRQVR
jgi:hypothetical protein